MKNYTIPLLTVLFSLISQVGAADDLRLGEPIAGGTGCPQGSYAAVLSPDQKTLSLLFDAFSAQAGGSVGKTLDRKSCNVAIPIHIPNGYSVSIFQVDYRGFTSVPRGGRAQLTAEYFFAGMRGPRLSKSFTGPRDRDYTFSNELQAEALVWSPCGADTNIRINASMVAQSNYYMEDTLATVDSADIQSGLIYHIQFRRCR